jgi:hypothetical protein
MFAVGVAVILGSVAWRALGKQLPLSPDGRTALDLFADQWLLGSASLALAGLFAVGLWRGTSSVRYLIMGSWIAAFLLAATRALHHVPPVALVDDLALFIASVGLLWWYLFKKASSVRFFSANGA